MQPEDTPAKLPEGPPNSSDPVKVDSLPRSNRAADWRRYFGPGFLVAAAFIGPGTVGTAIKAGGGFGFQLLWGVGFAVFATIVFQEMAARLGLIAKMGLGEAFVNSFPNPVFRTTAIGIVFAAILFGNAAYQAGNVSGAATGLVELVPGLPAWCWVACCSLTALALIGFGSLKILKVVLVGMVLMMSFTFVVAAVLSRPDFPLLLSGCFSFEVPFYDLGILIAIIGTTVVPYNLFLHSSAVAEQNRDLDVELHQGEITIIRPLMTINRRTKPCPWSRLMRLLRLPCKGLVWILKLASSLGGRNRVDRNNSRRRDSGRLVGGIGYPDAVGRFVRKGSFFPRPLCCWAH